MNDTGLSRKPDAPPPGKDFTKALEESQIFKDYECAFVEASGMHLLLKDAGEHGDGRPVTDDNSFCKLMAQTRPACVECLKLQKRLETSARTGPRTLQCFAGLCETAVPVRVSGQLVAFLKTGHVMRTQPNRRSFSKVAKTLLDWGARVDLKSAEDAWLASKVLTPAQYEAFVRMLVVFAHHLEVCGMQLGQQPRPRTADPAPRMPRSINTAKEYIIRNATGPLSLQAVARAVNLSAQYLCKQFHQCTGMTFNSYIASVRVEKARQLLDDVRLRISEVAYGAGFQSVSQFNRVFRRMAGMSPSEFRGRRR